MKKWLFGLSVLGLTVLGVIYLSVGVNAQPTTQESFSTSLEVDENGEYSIEDMLVAALLDEYLAQATYAKILEVYGDIKPFSKILLAEQRHIDLLLPLFDTYGIEVPENTMADQVVLPESISSALATGVEAEKANIAIYEAFLEQENVPDDVKVVFESLKAASENHLAAFSKDRLNGAGYDLQYRIRNMIGRGENGQQGLNARGNRKQLGW